MPIRPYIGVVFPFKGSLSLDLYHFYFLILDNFEGNDNISVAIKSSSTVYGISWVFISSEYCTKSIQYFLTIKTGGLYFETTCMC